MDQFNQTDRSYRVVRYYPDFGVGVVADVIGSHLTKEEAEKIAKENPAIVSDEHIFVEKEGEPDRSVPAPNEEK